MGEFLTAAEAAQRLGVKPATLYAYVSRGVLRRDHAADGRSSLFDSDEVERLARRGRPRRPVGAADIVVESAITEITGDRLRYRGLDVIRLATSRTFEDVAELLWTGELPASPGGRPPRAAQPGRARSARVPGSAPWRATPAALAAGRGAQAALPAGTLPLERFQVIVPAMAATDPLRLQLDPAAVLAAGRSIIAGLVDCLPSAAPGSDSPISDYPVADYPVADYPVADYPIAEAAVVPDVRAAAQPRPAARPVGRAGPAGRPRARRVHLGRTGRRVGAGRPVRGGRDRNGGDERRAARRGVPRRGDAAGRGQQPGRRPPGSGRTTAPGEKVPGFGHFVYRTGDPRAVLLLDLVRRAAPKSGQLAVAEAVLAEVRRKSLPEPNIDLAIATLARVAGMIRGSGEAIFAVARTAGWIAHALEAYAGPGPLRPRAVYTGRPPTADR